jgi:HPt (histidine-containing phosphotransfer) domain-containing protein
MGGRTMSDGAGCQCGAYAQFECACDVDWTPQEVYDLRERIDKLTAELETARDECLEQAVLLGKSGCREAVLLTEIQRVQMCLHEAVNDLLMRREMLTESAGSDDYSSMTQTFHRWADALHASNTIVRKLTT